MSIVWKKLIGQLKSKHIFTRGANRGKPHYYFWGNPDTLKLYIELFITKNRNNYYMLGTDILNICEMEKPKH